MGHSANHLQVTYIPLEGFCIKSMILLLFCVNSLSLLCLSPAAVKRPSASELEKSLCNLCNLYVEFITLAVHSYNYSMKFNSHAVFTVIYEGLILYTIMYASI